VLILPYIEQDNFYKMRNFEYRYAEQPTNPDLRPHNVKTFFCPSRRSSDAGLSLNDVPSAIDLGPFPGGLSDYA
jgi:hypothetical protein